ncbi:MAG: DUF1800 family protein [Rhodospirillaceae bacterium]
MATPHRIALNRVTFGARDLDEMNVNFNGWRGWVENQLNAPPGDDSDLAGHLAAQTMRINYAAANPERPRETWAALDEMRGLNYIGLPPAELWRIHTSAGSSLSPSERTRVRQELAAATWIRNAHSRYQLREFMVDFWHNHFNISKNEAEGATVLLPAFDKVIRDNVFGNFRTLLEATATSGSMLIYLDNYLSTSSTPNENYAREIIELHTLGGEAYYGVGDTGSVPMSATGVPVGFTDQDVLQASRALSGWTIQYGQQGPGAVRYPNSGEFIYNSRQHNTRAGTFLGRNLANLVGDMAQGRAVLDSIATHSATARHVVGRLTRRIFGDRAPSSAFDRGVAAFNANRDAPDQIKHVLRAILLHGDEVFNPEITKVRRPYERILALVRTTDMVLTASTTYLTALDRLTDALFAWPAPDGRPDYDGFWLATGANLATWNLLFQVPAWASVQTSLAAQTPMTARESATETVEYWVNRMVSGRLSESNMNILVGDQAGANGAPTMVRTRRSAATIENAYRRLVSLIATTNAFSVR